MAYGVKYRSQFYDIDDDRQSKLDILEDGYGGGITTLTSTDNPVVIRLNKTGIIRGLELTYSFVATAAETATYDEFLTSVYKDKKIKFYADGTNLTFEGWLKPENTGRSMYPVVEYRLTATDGLADLEDLEYDNAGVLYRDTVSVLLTIKRALLLVGFTDLDFFTQVNTWEKAEMVITEDPLIKVDVDNRRFIDVKDGEEIPMNAYEVLEHCLKIFNCILFQKNGYYYIVNNQEYNSLRTTYNWADLSVIDGSDPSNRVIDINAYTPRDTPWTLNKIEPIKTLRVKFENINIGGNECTDGDFSAGGTAGWTDVSFTTFLNGGGYLRTGNGATLGDATDYFKRTADFNIASFDEGDLLEISFKIKLDSIVFPGPEQYPEIYCAVDYPGVGLPVEDFSTIITQVGEWVTIKNRRPFEIPGVGLYSIRFYIKPHVDVTSYEYHWDDIVFTQLQSTLNVTSDTVFIHTLNGSAYKKEEITTIFGDSLRLTEIGALKVGGVNTISWQRYNRTEALTLHQIIGQQYINNFQVFKDSEEIGLYDPNDNIDFETVLLYDAKYYEWITYSKNYKHNHITGEIQQLLISDGAINRYIQPLTSVDGHSTEQPSGIPAASYYYSYWQQTANGIYTLQDVAVGMDPTGGYDLEVAANAWIGNDLVVANDCDVTGESTAAQFFTSSPNTGADGDDIALIESGNGEIRGVGMGTGLHVVGGDLVVDLGDFGLGDLNDVDLSGAADGNMLYRTGGNWEDTAELNYNGDNQLQLNGVADFESWPASYSVLSSDTNAYYTTGYNMGWAQNLYYDGANWKYKSNGTAYIFRLAGGILYQGVGAGTTDNNIGAWTNLFQVTSAGVMFIYQEPTTDNNEATFLVWDAIGEIQIKEETSIIAAWALITGTPTTIDGYGITNAYTKAQLQTSGQSSVHWGNITNTPTTLANYGISDTKSNFDTALSDGSFAFDGGAHHDGFSDYVGNEHIDWTVTGIETLYDNRVQESNVTQHEAALSIATTQLTASGLSDGEVLRATGATTFDWDSLKLDDLANPSGNTLFTMTNKQIKFTWVTPVTADGAMELEVTGAFTGDLLHLHQHTGNPGATNLLYVKAEDPQVIPIFAQGAPSVAPAAIIHASHNHDSENIKAIFIDNINDNGVGLSFGNQGTVKWSIYNDAPTAGQGDVLGIDSAAGRKVTIKQDGSFGIGTIPLSNLHLASANLANDGTLSDMAMAFTFDDAPGNPSTNLAVGMDDTVLRPFIQSRSGNTIYRRLLLQPYGGNVGIGTTTPNARLEIEDAGIATASIPLLKLTTDNATPYALVIGNDSYVNSEIDGLKMYVGNTGYAYIISHRGTATAAYLPLVFQALNYRFDIAGSQKIWITSDGIGIGATPSNSELKIYLASGNADINIETDGGTSQLVLDATGDTMVRFRVTGTTKFIMGVDQSDSETFKIGTTGLSSNTRFSINTAGAAEFFVSALSPIFYVDNTNTHIQKDGSNNMLFTDSVTGAKTLAELAAGGGDVSVSGTPVDNQLAIWTDATTIEGVNTLAYDGTNLGIGISASMKGKVHIYIAASGVAAAYSLADELVIESNGDAGISILTTATDAAYISFGRPTYDHAGAINYNHSTNVMGFYTRNTGQGELRFSISKTEIKANVPITLQTYNVAGAPTAADIEGATIYVTNGDAGAKCLAMSDGTNWKVISLGATIST